MYYACALCAKRKNWIWVSAMQIWLPCRNTYDTGSSDIVIEYIIKNRSPDWSLHWWIFSDSRRIQESWSNQLITSFLSDWWFVVFQHLYPKLNLKCLFSQIPGTIRENVVENMKKEAFSAQVVESIEKEALVMSDIPSYISSKKCKCILFSLKHTGNLESLCDLFIWLLWRSSN